MRVEIGVQLPTQFSMRPYPDQLQRFVVGLAINQHQIWLYMAVTVVFPIAGQRMVAVTNLQWRIGRKGS